MRENGYETTAIYDNVHFGYPGGPYIDNLIVNNTQSEGVCSAGQSHLVSEHQE